jgi:hypothetical protein
VSAADLIHVKEVAALLPLRDGKPVCIATLYRWIKTGILRDGVRHKLRAVRVGGALYVDRRDLRAFLEGPFEIRDEVTAP